MLGRLIIALLVIGSAFAVTWHQKRTDAATLESAVAETKAGDAEKRAVDAEKRAHDAEQRALAAEAKAAFFESELAKTSAAADDPVNAERALHITKVSVKPLTAELARAHHGVVALALAGDPAEITRIRVFAANAAGEQVWHEAWDTAPGSPAAIDVVHGGQVVVAGHADTVLQTKPGATLLELRLSNSASFVPGMSYAVEVTADGHVSTQVFTQPAPALASPVLLR